MNSFSTVFTPSSEPTFVTSSAGTPISHASGANTSRGCCWKLRFSIADQTAERPERVVRERDQRDERDQHRADVAGEAQPRDRAVRRRVDQVRGRRPATSARRARPP